MSEKISIEEVIVEAKERCKKYVDSETFDRILENDNDFLESMNALFKDLNSDNFQVPMIAKKQEFTERVARRVRYLDFIDHHPEIRDIKIIKPIVILGIFRTGTTLLYNLMSQTPGIRSPKMWEIFYPNPPPKKDTYETDPRITVAKIRLELIESFGYNFKALHEINHNWPEECMFFWREENYCTEINLHGAHKNYVKWFEAADKAKMYRAHKLFLQYLSYNYPPETCWLLKAPIHLVYLRQLVNEYGKSNIRLVVTHRDPLESIPSTISLWVLYGSIEMKMTQKEKFEAARRMLDIISRGWIESMAMLDELESEGYGDAFIHVYYTDIVKDPFSVIQKVHNYFEIGDPNFIKMKEWMNENPKGKHGKHEYSLEEYGLTPHDVYTAFYPYYQRYFPNVQIPSIHAKL